MDTGIVFQWFFGNLVEWRVSPGANGKPRSPCVARRIQPLRAALYNCPFRAERYRTFPFQSNIAPRNISRRPFVLRRLGIDRGGSLLPHQRGHGRHEAEAGRIYGCAATNFGGYPFRIEVACAEPSVDDRATALSIRARNLAAVAQVWDPTLVIGEIEGPMTVSPLGGCAECGLTFLGLPPRFIPRRL